MSKPQGIDFCRYTFLFDTNSIRDMARKYETEEAWAGVVTEWKRQGFTTAWMPGTIAELAGTNLIGTKNPLTVQECQQIALAIRRFDMLAKQTFLPTIHDLLRWAITLIAGDYCTFPPTEDWGKLVRRAKKLSHPDEVEVPENSEESFSIRLQMQDGSWIGQTIPLGFEKKAIKEQGEWKKRLIEAGLHAEGMTREEVEATLVNPVKQKAILKLMVERHIIQVAMLGKHMLGMAESTVLACIENFKHQSFLNPLLFGNGAQDWYFIQRALGIKTGRIWGSFGRDLQLAYSVPLAKHFVTSDGKLRGIINGILPRNPLMTFPEFMEVVANGSPSSAVSDSPS